MGCSQFGRLHKLRLHEPQLVLNRGGGSAANVGLFFLAGMRKNSNVGEQQVCFV
ncbi:hypothetical protein D3C72_613460 [compost metagenome]